MHPPTLNNTQHAEVASGGMELAGRPAKSDYDSFRSGRV